MGIESCNLLAAELLDVQKCIIDTSGEQDLMYVPKTRQASSGSVSNVPQTPTESRGRLASLNHSEGF